MRPDDFEERLRQALQARAADVTPDPATWLRVRDRIERRQRPRWVTALAAVAPLVIVAAVAAAVVLGALERDRRDVLLDQPSPNPSPSPSEPVAEAAMVLAAEPGIVLADAAGQPLSTLYSDPAASECAQNREGCEAEVVTVTRPRPAAEGSELVVAYLEEFEPCFGQVGIVGGPSLDASGAICPTAPVWSPDGEFVAFLQRFSEGGYGLSVTPWGGETGEVQDLQGDQDLANLRLHAWIWNDIADGTPSGYLALTAMDEDGEGRLYYLPIAASGSEIEVTGPIEPLGSGGGFLAYASGSTAPVSAEGPTYTVEMIDGRAELRWSGEGEVLPPLVLPDEVLDSNGGPVWVTAAGNTALFGDGVDDAWRVERRGGGWGPIERLPGEVRFAEPLTEISPSSTPDLPAGSAPTSEAGRTTSPSGRSTRRQ